MRLRREVHNDIKLLLVKESVDHGTVCDIPFYELESRVVAQNKRLKSCQVSGICKTVKADDLYVVMIVEHIVDKVASYKARSTCYKNFFHNDNSLAKSLKNPYLSAWSL